MLAATSSRSSSRKSGSGRGRGSASGGSVCNGASGGGGGGGVVVVVVVVVVVELRRRRRRRPRQFAEKNSRYVQPLQEQELQFPIKLVTYDKVIGFIADSTRSGMQIAFD